MIADKFNEIGIEKTGKQCRERWLNYVNPKINHEKLTEEEEDRLFFYFREMGTKWVEISKKFKSRSENVLKNTFYSQVRRINNFLQKTYQGFGIKSIHKKNQIFQ